MHQKNEIEWERAQVCGGRRKDSQQHQKIWIGDDFKRDDYECRMKVLKHSLDSEFILAVYGVQRDR